MDSQQLKLIQYVASISTTAIVNAIREVSRPRFITVTYDDKPVRIGVSTITDYREEGDGTLISVFFGGYNVTETPDEIDRLVQEAYR